MQIRSLMVSASGIVWAAGRDFPYPAGATDRRKIAWCQRPPARNVGPRAFRRLLAAGCFLCRRRDYVKLRKTLLTNALPLGTLHL
jgi:hypothetical protein